eukprot:1214597-Pleurochrysis_carterae.AAC.1
MRLNRALSRDQGGSGSARYPEAPDQWVLTTRAFFQCAILELTSPIFTMEACNSTLIMYGRD